MCAHEPACSALTSCVRILTANATGATSPLVVFPPLTYASGGHAVDIRQHALLQQERCRAGGSCVYTYMMPQLCSLPSHVSTFGSFPLASENNRPRPLWPALLTASCVRIPTVRLHEKKGTDIASPIRTSRRRHS